MKRKLDEMGFSNVSVMYNFKDIYPLDENELINDHAEPFRFCTFSRVSKEKGIEDAISAVKSLNDEYGKIVATLDIYGHINSDYVEKFEQIKKTLPDYIKYKGVVSSKMSIEAIKGYYMLMFPTYYEGEGFAGTLIDAFSSGLPVIATDWRYNGEIVEDGVTGLVYSYKEKALLKEKIKFACENPSVIQKMRPNCLKESRKYLPEIAIQPLYDNI